MSVVCLNCGTRYDEPGDKIGDPSCPRCGCGPGGEKPKLYDVHIYTIARVKVCNVPGDSQETAIRNAEKYADFHQAIDKPEVDSPRKDDTFIKCVEWGEEEADSYLVDECGDEGHERTQQWERTEVGGLKLRGS